MHIREVCYVYYYLLPKRSQVTLLKLTAVCHFSCICKRIKRINLSGIVIIDMINMSFENQFVIQRTIVN